MFVFAGDNGAAEFHYESFGGFQLTPVGEGCRSSSFDGLHTSFDLEAGILESGKNRMTIFKSITDLANARYSVDEPESK